MIYFIGVFSIFHYDDFTGYILSSVSTDHKVTSVLPSRCYISASTNQFDQSLSRLSVIRGEGRAAERAAESDTLDSFVKLKKKRIYLQVSLKTSWYLF